MEIPHQKMMGVVLTAHGSFDKLQLRTDLPIPEPGRNEVLIHVLACGVNNTDISTLFVGFDLLKTTVDTRVGWYSKSVKSDTEKVASEVGLLDDEDGSWTGEPLSFPLIQGADVCGIIVAVGEGIESSRIGERVIVASMQPHPSGEPWTCITLGSEIPGGFAQYVTTRSSTAYRVQSSSWSDAQLASIPCAWSTAENMLLRAQVTERDHILITGASGGVGSAAVQLAKLRGARVTAVAGGAKAESVRSLGADSVVVRGESLLENLGENSIDVVCDVVAGPQFGEYLQILRRGGRYAVVGAIGGPIVELDVRTLYLKDLSFFGCTVQKSEVMPNLVSYIERDAIRAIVAKEYPLGEIVRAQADFLEKRHTGKLVLIPPSSAHSQD